MGNLEGFDPSEAVPLEELEEFDRWILHRAAVTMERVEKAYREYEFHTIYHALVQFCTVELSNVYMDVTKDRMYCEAPDSAGRRSGQTTYWLVLRALVRAMAPILSFTCEEVWEHIPTEEKTLESIFLTDFPSEAADWRDDELGAKWEQLLEVRQEVQRAMEKVRAPRGKKKEGHIGSSQQAHVTVVAEGSTLEMLREYEGQLNAPFISSEAEVAEGPVDGEAPVKIKVRPSTGQKCPRCWNYWIEADSDEEICARCATVVQGL